MEHVKKLSEMSVMELKSYYYDQLVQKEMQEQLLERIEENLAIMKSEIIRRKPEEKTENV